MKSTASIFSLGYSRMMILYLVLLVSYARTQGEDSLDRALDVDVDPFARPLGPLTDSYGRSLGPAENAFARSLGTVEDSFARSLGARYIGNGVHVKGGWRPVMAGGSTSFISDTGHKVFTGPAHIETKAYNVHGFGLSGHSSTSSRPLNTRDVNKISNIAQTYKPSIYPQNGVNLNAPVNSYLNPFAFTSNAALNSYKLSPGFHFDNNVYLKQQTSHRPHYTKQPQQQLLLGMRVKPNQYQIMQQHPNNQFHHQQQQQQLPTYQQQVNVKKPIESYSRPSDNYNQYHHHHEGYPKPNEHKFPVNPQESLNKQTQQTKTHSSQSISAVTYKPPTGSHFPQFGINEDSFAPIPSSILGSFSSFGHASVKARDPPQFNSKSQYSTIEPTKTPEASTVTKDYVSSSTAYTEVKVPPKDPKATSTVNQNYNNAAKDDYKDGLVPPPQINKPANNGQNYRNPSTERNNPYKDNFIPSPVDPLSKGHKVEISKFPATNIKYVDKPSKSTKRPIVTSFFDSNIISPSTISPFEAHSTHVVPDNLIVQLPSPQSPFNTFGGQSNKIKNQKDKHQVYSSVNHNAATTKYSVFDDVQHFPAHEFYDNTFNKNKNPPKHSYEVTEGWEPFGEDPTQPSINSWGHPSQTFKQYNNVLGPPNGLNHAVPTFYPPTISSNNPDINAYSDVSTIFSIVSESNQQHDIHGLENSLTSPGPQGNEHSEQSNKQVVISPSPNYINMNTDRPRIITTDAYQETTTTPTIFNSRRKPSRYRPQQETTTEDFKDVTTRFETYKENVPETGNDLLANDLPTIPPNKHFKRPLTATTTSYPVEEDDKLKKRNKNRRRRPLKSTSSTSDDIAEESATENTFKLQRDRTTTLLPEVEETTKLPRNRLRFPQKARPTRPSAQPELTSSAQPTVIPTHPVTLRSKLHSRIRTTTQSPLDFDESIETTTIRDKNNRVHEKQSSIMKIAKDNHLHRPSVIKYSSSFGTLNNAPDYSHKQDEKDTPTSDISLHLSENKYSAQKENNLSFTDLFMDLDSEVQPSAQDAFISPTTTSQPSEQLEPHATQLALNDGKSGYETTLNNEDISNPNDGENSKTSKLYGNRPRFSVKDYRNRLNQYTSSTTEKPTQSTESSPRLRFPNRSRFSNNKDAQDSKSAASDVDNATEPPRKKFLPKDSKHKANELNSEKATQHKTNSSADNEYASKASNKFRSSLRRDPIKQSVGTTVIPEVTDRSKLPSNLKRPSIIRKRVQVANKTDTTVETLTTEAPTTTEKTIPEQTIVIENVTSTEKSTSETAIMKIAKDDKKHTSTENGSSSDLDQSQRVADLTLAASKDYDTPGMFKSVSPNSRRVVPNYFTIATDDPILPIEAFFPQLNQKKNS